MRVTSVLFVDGNDDVIVAEHIVALRPALHCVVIDGLSPLCVLGKCIEEVCVEEVDPINRYLEFIVKVSKTLLEPPDKPAGTELTTSRN